MHRLFDQVVAEHALELVAAEAPVVRLVVICGCDDGADVAVADLADHAAVVVEDLTHRLASLVPFGVGVRNGHSGQQPLEEVALQLVVAVPLRLHGD